jgi:hypothetical protein
MHPHHSFLPLHPLPKFHSTLLTFVSPPSRSHTSPSSYPHCTVLHRHQTLMTLSSWSTIPLEEVASSAPGGYRWFQLYVYKVLTCYLMPIITSAIVIVTLSVVKMIQPLSSERDSLLQYVPTRIEVAVIFCCHPCTTISTYDLADHTHILATMTTDILHPFFFLTSVNDVTIKLMHIQSLFHLHKHAHTHSLIYTHKLIQCRIAKSH